MEGSPRLIFFPMPRSMRILLRIFSCCAVIRFSVRGRPMALFFAAAENTPIKNNRLNCTAALAGGKEPATCDSEIHYVGGVENVDAGVLAPFDYAALGHIHRAQHIGAEKYRYCGTPFPYSISEAGEEKSVTVVELGAKGQPPVIRQIPLTPVREVKKLTGTLHEILEQAGQEVCHAFVSITLTDDVEAFQPKERLEEKYDHILEIRIDNARTRKLLSDTEEQLAEVRPEEAFAMFFAEMNGREMTPEERELMRQVIAQEMEGDE